MKIKYFIELSFNGTKYHGWQVQPNAITVQEVLERNLSMLLREKIETTGCGRTDTGVHAKLFVAHFESCGENLHRNDPLLRQINSVLPMDIAVKKINKVIPEAHARYDATQRTYEYLVSSEKDPFKQDLIFYYRKNLDIHKLNQASSLLLKYSDFKSFSKLHSDNKTTVCKIHKAEWNAIKSEIIFTITADRFLRSMVRTIVGTLLKVGSGKLSLEEFKSIIESKDRFRAASSAPACGLYLNGISYPNYIYIWD